MGRQFAASFTKARLFSHQFRASEERRALAIPSNTVPNAMLWSRYFLPFKKAH
jgi:hypothetical protein